MDNIKKKKKRTLYESRKKDSYFIFFLFSNFIDKLNIYNFLFSLNDKIVIYHVCIQLLRGNKLKTYKYKKKI